MVAVRNQEAIAATLEAAAESTVLEELGDAVARLAGLVGASGTLLYRFDPDGVPQAVLGTLAPAISSYTFELFQGDPIQRALFDARTLDSVVTPRLIGVEPRTMRGSAAHTDWYRPHDIEHLLALWIRGERYGIPGMAGILLTRSHRQPNFDEPEAGILRRTRSAFAAAGRRSQRVEQLAREREAMGAVMASDAERARLALDPRGELRWISPSAEQLLLGRERRRLEVPPALLRAAANSADAAGRVELVLEDGRPLVAELSRCRTPSGERLVAVELHFAGLSPTDLAALCARHGLTRAEGAVANVLALGLSNAEIAARLHVSLETVRTHVQRILGKLAVASRVDAAGVIRGFSA